MAIFFFFFADFVTHLLDSSRLLFKAVILQTSACCQRRNEVHVRACLLSTWQHWISIGPLSTICSFMVHLGFAQSKGIYLGIEGHSPLLYVPITNRLFDHSYSKAEGFLFLFLTGTLHSIG